MTVVSFVDYTPVARFDENPWTDARIEGSDTADGPWAALETIALDPVDPDPANPQTRNLTTEEATDETWFRVVFVDADGDESATDPVRFPTPNAALRPALREVGAIIRAYTRSDASGGTAGTFTDNTSPTAAEVQEDITNATAEVALRLPDDLAGLDEEIVPFARRLAAIRAAMYVIISLQSDQDSSEDSAYDRLKGLYDDGWGILENKLQQTGKGGVKVGSVALTSPFSGTDELSLLDFDPFPPVSS